eukprot:scaffold321074_cov17-Prasinocladus_malaysianus.AAC.1
MVKQEKDNRVALISQPTASLKELHACKHVMGVNNTKQGQHQTVMQYGLAGIERSAPLANEFPSCYEDNLSLGPAEIDPIFVQVRMQSIGAERAALQDTMM